MGSVQTLSHTVEGTRASLEFGTLSRWGHAWPEPSPPWTLKGDCDCLRVVEAQAGRLPGHPARDYL